MIILKLILLPPALKSSEASMDVEAGLERKAQAGCPKVTLEAVQNLEASLEVEVQASHPKVTLEANQKLEVSLEMEAQEACLEAARTLQARQELQESQKVART